jgi:hypothetical protein
MVQLVRIRYVGGRAPGFEHVMKRELALALEKRGQVEILPEAPAEEPKAKREARKKAEAKE